MIPTLLSVTRFFIVEQVNGTQNMKLRPTRLSEFRLRVNDTNKAKGKSVYCCTNALAIPLTGTLLLA
jgi:hypothetical protein